MAVQFPSGEEHREEDLKIGISAPHMEEFYEHIEAVWLERVPLQG
jgi:hypothetical protein